MSIEFKYKDNGQKGSFTFRDGDYRAAEMTYVWIDDYSIIIDHTGVNEKYRKQGLGKQLVEKAVAFAREREIKILPLCPFARSVFDKTPEYGDVRLNR